MSEREPQGTLTLEQLTYLVRTAALKIQSAIKQYGKDHEKITPFIEKFNIYGRVWAKKSNSEAQKTVGEAQTIEEMRKKLGITLEIEST